MNTSELKTYTFHVKGMHCNACTIVIEDELSKLKEVTRAHASLQGHTLEVSGNFGDATLDEVSKKLEHVIRPHGYTLSTDNKTHTVKWSDFRWAVPIALAFIVVFIGLQKLGIVDLVTTSEVGYGTAFVIGLIASVSSCMAVVGGLVLSMSANFAKQGSKTRPQIAFHIARLATFFILGGVIGALGSVFQFGIVGSFVLSLIVAIVLLILGLNLLDITPWADKLQLTLPGSISKRVQALKNMNSSFMPVLVGIATFFLPCGFTQSMQIYTLTTGSFWTGALTMFAFALGTLPVLAILSFSSAGIHKRAQSGIFFKTAGIIVVFFGILNLLSSLIAIGLIPPILNF